MWIGRGGGSNNVATPLRELFQREQSIKVYRNRNIEVSNGIFISSDEI